MDIKKHVIRMGKALIVSVILTGALLLIMALILYKTNLSGIVEHVMVAIIYVMASLVGGFLLGKQEEKRRFLWGAGFGVLYFLVLMILGGLIPGAEKTAVQAGTENSVEWSERIRVLLICGLSGMVGGMLS